MRCAAFADVDAASGIAQQTAIGNGGTDHAAAIRRPIAADDGIDHNAIIGATAVGMSDIRSDEAIAQGARVGAASNSAIAGVAVNGAVAECTVFGPSARERGPASQNATVQRAG